MQLLVSEHELQTSVERFWENKLGNLTGYKEAGAGEWEQAENRRKLRQFADLRGANV